jgi:beta-alanine--pyruvate transaminase
VTFAPYFEDAVHSLRELPHVIDVRNMGLVAGIELEPVPGKPTARAFEAFQRCYEKGVLIRTDGRHHRIVTAADHQQTAD